MCGNYFNFHASRDSGLNPTAYHIHIYFQPGTEGEQDALDVTQKLQQRFPWAVEDAHRVGKVGPHSQANIGVTITPDSFGEVVGWLQLNSKNLSILIHPRTGDEIVDHKQAAMWLGTPVAFNEKFFDSLKPATPKAPKP
ncbi:MAG TPA: DOPA 4,5-dioxygenase family protein [Patescibacteria group bacterium]|nr:DOPA 4,5-dioxygenase family protein [Patescibacteria group bacterium]